MSPKVIAILVVIVLVIMGGMALTMKKAADKRKERTAEMKTYQVRFPEAGAAGRTYLVRFQFA